MGLETFLEASLFGSFIKGSFRTDKPETATDFISPALQENWKQLCPAAGADVSTAIDGAEEAFKVWRSIPPPQRGALLRKIGDAMLQNRGTLARVMALEMGKPLKDGLREVDYAAGYYHWYAGEAERIYGQLIPSQYPEKRLMLLHEPAGVCGIITPWNFPQAMAARKIAAALAAGCTVVCKPAMESPFSLLLLAKICSDVNVPPGIVNIVIGPEKEIGAVLLDSPKVRKLSFTGSTEVGKYLYGRSAQTLKKLTLELGGHAPFLVFSDADIDKAVEGLLAAKFRNNGQTCIAANRILIQSPIYDQFVEKLIGAIKKLRVGNPLDPEVDISDVLHPASLRKVEAHLKDALNKGANLLLAANHIYEPAVLGGINSSMTLWREETFGPLVPLRTFETFEEGITLANDCEYGLASYAFTGSLACAERLMDQLEFGIIGLNDGLPSTPQAAFGGVKSSGFGREGGPGGIREYMVEKYVSLRIDCPTPHEA